MKYQFEIASEIRVSGTSLRPEKPILDTIVLGSAKHLKKCNELFRQMNTLQVDTLSGLWTASAIELAINPEAQIPVCSGEITLSSLMYTEEREEPRK